MKKIVFFIPAILLALFYGFIIIEIGLYPEPFVYLLIALLILSGVLLAKGICWGGAFGMLAGLPFMYMSTQDTGQVLPIEMPLGIIIVAFYLICSFVVFYKKKKAVK